MSSRDVIHAYAPAFFGLAASRLIDRIVEEGGEAARKAGLTAPVRTYSMLIVLQEEALTVTEIAGRLGVTHAAVIKQSKPLLDARLIARRQDAADRRRMPLSLTDRGRREAAKVVLFMKAAQQVYQDLFKEVGADMFEAILRFDAALDRTPFDQRMQTELRGKRR